MKSPRSSSSLPFLNSSYALSLIARLNGSGAISRPGGLRSFRLTARPERLDLVEDRRRHRRLRAALDGALALGGHDRDLVVVGVEADARARDVVHHDGV